MKFPIRRSMSGIGALGVALSVLCVFAPGAFATYPGHNGRLVFGGETQAGTQLYTVRPNGTDLRRITDLPGDAVQADWSPDGTRIVFELDHPEGDPFCSIELVNADGSGRVDLTGASHGCEAQPSFTPDGRRIVFERYDDVTNVDAIWSMDLAGGTRQLITTGSGGVTDPNVSPDGKTLSFIDYNGLDLGQALATTRIDGSGLFHLTPFTFDVAIKQDWAPDGRQLVFGDNADDFSKPANIATIRPDGTGLRYITDLRSPDTRAYVGGYSPDGNWIVFRLEDHGRYALYRMRPDGGAKHVILPLSDFRPRGIDWGSR
jgi:Tol biopolymer transport system component